jgi:hypothetical protein
LVERISSATYLSQFKGLAKHNSPAEIITPKTFERLGGGFLTWLADHATSNTVRLARATLKFICGCVLYYKLVGSDKDLTIHLFCSQRKCEALLVRMAARSRVIPRLRHIHRVVCS